MSDETARLVHRLRARLQRATRRMTWAELAFGGGVAAGSAATFWLVAAALEAVLWLPPTVRTALVILGAATLLGVSGAFLARPLGRLLGISEGPTEEEVARTVGQHYPDVDDRLVDVLQLAEGQRSDAPAPYVDRAVYHLAEQIREVEFEEIADFQPARTAARWASVPLLAVIAFLLAAPSTFLQASEHLLAPQTNFDRPAPFQFGVTPGDTRVVKGDSLRITVRATGAAPGSATLLLRSSDEETPRRIALDPSSGGTFRHTLANVRRPLRYRIVASPVRTPWYEVTVVNRPFLRQLQLRVSPPAYTRRPSRTLAPNAGTVTALPGSRVKVMAALGGASVAEATLHFEEAPTQPLTLHGDSATGSFVVRGEDHYVLRLRSEAGVSNRDPIQYEVRPQSDARPSVSFLKPTGPAKLTPALTQDLRLQLSDDYGFRRVALFYRRVNGSDADSTFSSMQLPLSQPRQVDQVLTHTWLLAQESGLNLERGEAVAYYVKVWDNDTVNGPKPGRTATQRLRFPSLSSQYEEANDLQQKTGEQMRRLNRESESLRQQFRKLRQELRRTRQADWEDRRQLERLQQQQESLRKGQQELSQQVDSLNRKLQRNDLSSPDITKKFRELKRTIDEMAQSKGLQKALQQLRQSMKKRSFRRMQRSMESAKSRLQQQQRQLQRTLNLFKQLQAQQKMEELTRRAQNLSEREKNLGKKTENRMSPSADPDSTRQSTSSRSNSKARASDSTRTPPSDSSAVQPQDSAAGPDSIASRRSDSLSAPSPRSAADSSAHQDLAREQRELAKDTKRLMESMKKAEQEMKDVPSAPKKRLRTLRKRMQQRNLPKQMRRNSRQLQKNQLRKARRQQRRIQKQLQQMQSRLSKMKKQMQGRQRRMNIAGLRNALENTLRLSKDQEALRKTVEGLSGGGPTVRQYARRQRELSEGLQDVADSLQAIAGRLPRMSQAVQKQTGNALRAMKQATTSLDERKANRATGFQKTSMMHLNELALLLSSLLDQMNQQGGGGGQMSMQQVMQQLQKASGQQQKLNKQIQKFLNQVQGQRLSKNMEARRQQLARQQRKIKNQLQQMNMSEDAKQKLMGNLQKIAEQMETSAEELEQGRHSRDLLKRQQQILTRLLNAQQSLRTQGKKQERQGQRADQNVRREPPGERPAPETTDTLRRDLIRALEMGYNSDYEELIRRYFELLQQNREPQE